MFWLELGLEMGLFLLILWPMRWRGRRKARSDVRFYKGIPVLYRAEKSRRASVRKRLLQRGSEREPLRTGRRAVHAR